MPDEAPALVVGHRPAARLAREQLADRLLGGPVLLVPGDGLDRAGAARLGRDGHRDDVVPDDPEQRRRAQDDAHQLVALVELVDAVGKLGDERGRVLRLDAPPRVEVLRGGGDRAEVGGLRRRGHEQLHRTEEFRDPRGQQPGGVPLVVGEGRSGVAPQIEDRAADRVGEVGALALDGDERDAVHEEDDVEDRDVTGPVPYAELVDDGELVPVSALLVPLDVLDGGGRSAVRGGRSGEQ